MGVVALKHPVSVDTYAERTLSGAKAILVRLIGGEAYWPYGLATLQDLARRNGTAQAILPADGRPDPRLDELLAAHRPYGNTTALQMPAVFLRNATCEAPRR